MLKISAEVKMYVRNNDVFLTNRIISSMLGSYIMIIFSIETSKNIRDIDGTFIINIFVKLSMINIGRIIFNFLDAVAHAQITF